MNRTNERYAIPLSNFITRKSDGKPGLLLGKDSSSDLFMVTFQDDEEILILAK